MPRPKADQPLVSSVLDRLLDDRPGATGENLKTRNQVLRELKRSVRRDLENLLNTRWRCTTWPDDLKELERSLVNYGVPDVTGTDLGSKERRQDLLAVLRAVVERFEPRLKDVEVTMLDNAEPLDRVMRFRIRAMLHVEPAPEPVTFDSTLQPTTGNVEVKGTDR